MEEAVEADHVHDAGDGGGAADDGESTAAGLQGLVGSQEDGEAGTVDIVRVGEIDDQIRLAASEFLRDMRLKRRGAGKVDISASGDDGLIASVKRT